MLTVECTEYGVRAVVSCRCTSEGRKLNNDHPTQNKKAAEQNRKAPRIETWHPNAAKTNETKVPQDGSSRMICQALQLFLLFFKKTVSVKTNQIHSQGTDALAPTKRREEGNPNVVPGGRIPFVMDSISMRMGFLICAAAHVSMQRELQRTSSALR